MIARSKLVSLLLTGALGVGVGLVGIVGPAAASGPGTTYVTPGTGNPDTALTLNTTALCPAGNTNLDVHGVRRRRHDLPSLYLRQHRAARGLEQADTPSQ